MAEYCNDSCCRGGAEAPSLTNEKPQDVRANRPYRVAVTLTLMAVDADEAATRVLSQLPNNVTVKYIQASEEEDMPW